VSAHKGPTSAPTVEEDKALALNLGIGAAVLGWGFANWDYGSGGPRFQDEGWLDRETHDGGADKLGHFYTAYLFSHLFAGQYERWDFDKDQAIRWGALPSLGVTGLIEVGDAFSKGLPSDWRLGRPGPL
jgi:hypothetical protein